MPESNANRPSILARVLIIVAVWLVFIGRHVLFEVFKNIWYLVREAVATFRAMLSGWRLAFALLWLDSVKILKGE